MTLINEPKKSVETVTLLLLLSTKCSVKGIAPTVGLVHQNSLKPTAWIYPFTASYLICLELKYPMLLITVSGNLAHLHLKINSSPLIWPHQWGRHFKMLTGVLLLDGSSHNWLFFSLNKPPPCTFYSHHHFHAERKMSHIRLILVKWNHWLKMTKQPIVVCTDNRLFLTKQF